MKKLFIIFFILLMGCGGKLSDEQRKKLKEGMERETIKKVSDAELTEAAFDLGRRYAGIVEKFSVNDKKHIDSLQSLYHIRILPLQPGDSMLLELEKQIVEAYTTGSENIQLNDDIQKLGTDSMLYTKPVMKQSAGSLQFEYALGIRLSRKQVVLSIKE